MTDNSTTPPYSSATSSSTPTPAQNYLTIQDVPNVGNVNGSSNSLDWNQWGILLVSMALTGVIGYFSSLMAVKDEIAKNRQSISVYGEKINNLSSGVSEVKATVKTIDTLHSNVEILKVRVETISKQVDKQSEKIEKNQQGITQRSR